MNDEKFYDNPLETNNKMAQYQAHYPDLLAFVARIESIRSLSAKLRSSRTVLSSNVPAMLFVWVVARETKKFSNDPHFIRVQT